MPLLQPKPVPTPTMRPVQTRTSPVSFQQQKAMEAFNRSLMTQHQNIMAQGRNSVLGASTSRNVNPVAAAPVYNAQPAIDNVNKSTGSVNEEIDRDYETAMGGLNYQEQNLRKQGEVALGEVDVSAAKAKTALGEQQATNEAGLAKEESTAIKGQSSALQQARDLYRQMTQQNIAQLSGMGLSSSSVAEALSEKLGVETARRIAGVTGSTQEVLQNIAQERTRVTKYYQDKLANLEDEATQAKKQVQLKLMDGLSQINQARNQAATDKANRRAELWRDAQDKIFQIQQKAADVKYSLEEWNYKRQAGLEEAKRFVVSPTDFTAQKDWINKVGQLPQVGGFTAVPSFENTKQGLVPGYSYQRKSKDDLASQIEAAFQ